MTDKSRVEHVETKAQLDEARAARQDGWDAAIQAAGLAIAARAKNWESLPAETRHIVNLIARDIRALKMPEEAQPCPQCKGTGDQWNPIRGLIMDCTRCHGTGTTLAARPAETVQLDPENEPPPG